MNKDIRVLGKARDEIEKLRAELAAASRDIDRLVKRVVEAEENLKRLRRLNS